MDWPVYPYPAMDSYPYSIMSHERGRLFFVTCMETLAEAESIAGWLTSLRPSALRQIYFGGEAFKDGAA